MMKWMRTISKCRLERETKTWVKNGAECMERNVEETLFIFHTCHLFKKKFHKRLSNWCLSSIRDPNTVFWQWCIMLEGEGEKLLFLQVLVMPVSICWTEWPEKYLARDQFLFRGISFPAGCSAAETTESCSKALHQHGRLCFFCFLWQPQPSGSVLS